jgi:hypothetical protein
MPSRTVGKDFSDDLRSRTGYLTVCNRGCSILEIYGCPYGPESAGISRLAPTGPVKGRGDFTRHIDSRFQKPSNNPQAAPLQAAALSTTRRLKRCRSIGPTESQWHVVGGHTTPNNQKNRVWENRLLWVFWRDLMTRRSWPFEVLRGAPKIPFIPQRWTRCEWMLTDPRTPTASSMPQTGMPGFSHESSLVLFHIGSKKKVQRGEERVTRAGRLQHGPIQRRACPQSGSTKIAKASKHQ